LILSSNGIQQLADIKYKQGSQSSLSPGLEERLQRRPSRRAVCKACGWERSWNTTQDCVPHLESCEPYQKLLEQAGGEPMDSQKAWQAKQAGNTYLLYSRSSIKTYLKTTAKHQLVDLFAKAVYTSTANFSSFETPE
jgi:hypothetical protein